MLLQVLFNGEAERGKVLRVHSSKIDSREVAHYASILVNDGNSRDSVVLDILKGLDNLYVRQTIRVESRESTYSIGRFDRDDFSGDHTESLEGLVQRSPLLEVALGLLGEPSNDSALREGSNQLAFGRDNGATVNSATTSIRRSFAVTVAAHKGSKAYENMLRAKVILLSFSRGT